ncbi:hypothetical protein GCK32_005313, partial [Trichostrongylus colubriformis]
DDILNYVILLQVRRAILNRFPNDLLNCVNKEQLIANGGGARRALAAAAAAAANQPGPSSYNPLVGMQNFEKEEPVEVNGQGENELNGATAAV